MSRRKQGRPQQRKTLDSLEQEKDLLVCGDCQTSFALHDIVAFIRHKKLCCDKENLRQDALNPGEEHDDDAKSQTTTRCHKAGGGGRTNSDGDDAAAGTRRADDDMDDEEEDDDEGVDVSKASRRGEGEDVTADEDDDDDDDDDDDEDDDAEDDGEDCEEDEEKRDDAAMDTSGQHSMLVSEEERRRRRRLKKKKKKRQQQMLLKKEAEESAAARTATKKERGEGDREVKRERSSESRAPLRPKQVVDAESNTTHSEPSRFVCETCRSTYTSAWALLQHAQKEHGMKIYTSPTSGSASSNNSSSSNSGSRESSRQHHHHRSPLATSTPLPSSLSPMDLVVSSSSPRHDHQHHLHRPLSSSSASAIAASASSPYPVQHAPNPFTSPFRLPGLDARLPQPPASLSPYARGGAPPTSLDFDLITDYRLRPQFLPGRPGLDHPHGVPFPTHPGHRPAAHISPVQLDYDYYSMRLKQLAGSPVIGAGSGSKSPFSAAAASAALAHQHQQQQQQQQQQQHHQARSGSDRLTPTPGHGSSNNNKVAGSPSADLSPRSGSTNSALAHSAGSGGLVLPPKLKACEFCGKSFRFQSNLVVHRRSHTGEKPYKCSLCPHACTQQSKLKRHMKTHAAAAKAGTEAVDGDDAQAEAARSRKDGAEDEDDDDDEDDEEEEGEEEEEEEIMEEEMNDEEREVLERMKKAEKNEDAVAPEPGEIRHEAKRIKLENDKSIDGKEGDEEEQEEEEEEEKPSDLSMKRKPAVESVLSEVMKNTGLAAIQTYTEAYEAALAENQVNGQDGGSDAKSDKTTSSSGGRGRRHNGRDSSPDGPRQGVKREREADSKDSGREDERKEHLFLGGTDLLSKSGGKPERDGRTGSVPPGWPAGMEGLAQHHAAAAAALDPAAAAALYSRLPHPWFHPDNPVRLFFPGYPPRFPPHHSPRDLSLAAAAAAAADNSSNNNNNNNGLNLSHGSSGGGGAAITTTSSSSSSALPPSPSIPALYKPALSSPPSYPRRGASSASSSPTASLLLPTNGGAGGGTPRKSDNVSKRNDTCEYCGKVFKNCSNLTVHRRSHTGEKPYKCSLCSYACAQSSKLTRHMKTHGRLGKDVYPCKFCNMPFSVPSTLEKHMRKCVENRNAHLMSQDAGELSSESNGEVSMQSEPADMSGRQSEPLEMTMKGDAASVY